MRSGKELFLIIAVGNNSQKECQHDWPDWFIKNCKLGCSCELIHKCTVAVSLYNEQLVMNALR